MKALPLWTLFTAMTLGLTACHPHPAPPAPPPPPSAPPPAQIEAPGPVAFTGTLQEIPGVQGLLSLRHPKLVGQDLEKMMTAVPETAGLRVLLLQAAQFGYPEFSEITAGSNIGVFMLAKKAGDTTPPAYVGIAQLKPDGKLTTLLHAMGLRTQPHGKWTFIAQSPQILAGIFDPDAVCSFLEAPQTQDLRVWFRITPVLVAGLKEQTGKGMAAARAAGRQSAPGAAPLPNFDFVFSVLAQVHSAEATLNFGDRAASLRYAFQFEPDSPLGTVLRYPPFGSARAAQSLSRSAALAMVERANPRAMQAAINWFLQAFPAGTAPDRDRAIASTKAYFELWQQGSDGGIAAAFDLVKSPPSAPTPVMPSMIILQSGQWTPDMAHHLVELTQPMSSAIYKWMGAGFGIVGAGNLPAPNLSVSVQPHSITVDKVVFDRLETQFQMQGVASNQLQYIGAVRGMLVTANHEATLRQRLPAVASGAKMADSLPALAAPGQFAHAEFNGSRATEELFPLVGLDPADPDIRAELDKLRAGYQAGGPAYVDSSIAQAQLSATTTLPYGFVETTIRQFIYLGAKKVDWTRLFPKPPTPPPQPPRRPLPPAHQTL